MNYEAVSNMLNELYSNLRKAEGAFLSQKWGGDLTFSEFHTLERIGDSARSTMSEIASRLGITLGTLTTSVNRLIKKGYVFRDRSEKDKRVVYVGLTEKGDEAFRLHRSFHEEITAQVMKAVNPDEQKMLAGCLERICDYFVEHFGVSI